MDYKKLIKTTDPEICTKYMDTYPDELFDHVLDGSNWESEATDGAILGAITTLVNENKVLRIKVEEVVIEETFVLIHTHNGYDIYKVLDGEYAYHIYFVGEEPEIDIPEWECDSLDECNEWVQGE